MHADLAVIALFCMACALLPSHAIGYLAPGSVFNLTDFTVQLPVASPSGPGVLIIQPPDVFSYASEYFYLATVGNVSCMVFDCPINGSHTSGSDYPRSELRNLYEWNLGDGTQHSLYAELSVDVEPDTRTITIGQLHLDGVTGSCSIIVELEWIGGSVVAFMRDQNLNTVHVTVGSGYALGQKFWYNLTSDGTSVAVQTDSGAMAPYTYSCSWSCPCNYPVYFKAGAYLQEAGNDGSIYGQVSIYQFNVQHSISSNPTNKTPKPSRSAALPKVSAVASFAALLAALIIATLTILCAST